jgi:hypothetical protein
MAADPASPSGGEASSDPPRRLALVADQSLTGGPEAVLERCRHCRSELAQPLRWRRLAVDTWEIELRCPECRNCWSERVPTAAVKRLDRVLKEARGELERRLEEIERVDTEQRIAMFVEALRLDAILPEDFGRPGA